MLLFCQLSEVIYPLLPPGIARTGLELDGLTIIPTCVLRSRRIIVPRIPITIIAFGLAVLKKLLAGCEYCSKKRRASTVIALCVRN